MSDLPGGTVTFLFSDIESSTRHLRELGDDWEKALAAHNRILRESFTAAGGREVDRQGDAFFAVFPSARTALAAAARGGQVLVSESSRALVGGADLEDLGLHHLKDMEHAERLFQLVLPDLPGDFPAPRTLDRPEEKAFV